MNATLRRLVVALQFSTRLPLRSVQVGEGDLRQSAGLLPLAGVVVAGVGVLVRGLVGLGWDAAVATVAAVAVMVVVTGALHEDGLADTADGLWAADTPEARLAVMRDSRIGTYGTIALVVVLALRVALLAPLDLAGFARAVLAGHVLGRAAVPLLGAVLPPAGTTSAVLVTGRLGGAGAWLAGCTSVLAAVLAAGWTAPLLLAVAALAVAGCGLVVRRRLGGITGDAFGATIVVTEVVVLATVSALLH